MKLKVLSWNIWYDGDFEKISDFLSSFNADIIGLQELVPDDPTRDTIGLLKELGYHHVYAPVLTIKKDGRTMSNAVFSKHPIVSNKTHVLSEENSRNALQVDIKVGGEVFHIFSTHLMHTHQLPSDVQELQIDNLIKVLPKEKTIVMGDFNATPDSSVIQKMRSVMKDSEMKSIPTLDPTLFDCSKCEADLIPSTRLDYIFTSEDIKTQSFEVHKTMGSDHLPISVNIGI